LPKLRELQIVGNPLDYPTRDIVKKGSKYVIQFLREKWKNDQNIGEIITLNNKTNKVKKTDNKIYSKDRMKNKQAVIYYDYFTKQ